MSCLSTQFIRQHTQRGQLLHERGVDRQQTFLKTANFQYYCEKKYNMMEKLCKWLELSSKPDNSKTIE